MKSSYYEVFRDKRQEYRYRFVAKNGRKITGGESYKTKAGVFNAITLLQTSFGAEIREAKA